MYVGPSAYMYVSLLFAMYVRLSVRSCVCTFVRSFMYGGGGD